MTIIITFEMTEIIISNNTKSTQITFYLMADKNTLCYNDDSYNLERSDICFKLHIPFWLNDSIILISVTFGLNPYYVSSGSVIIS